MKDIKVEMFALCQGAHDLNGHLTIVNTMDEFTVQSLPARISFGLAIKLYVKANIGGERILSINIIDKDKANNKTSDSIQIIPEIKAGFNLVKLDKASHVNVALNLQNVIFEHEGWYDVHFEIDGERLDDFAFEVIQRK